MFCEIAMEKNSLIHYEKMLLDLLKASLNVQVPDNACFELAQPGDWKACAQLAKRQGVLALAWEGVKKLPQELQPYQSLKISWALAVERYEAEYKRYCDTVHELSVFFAAHGIRMVQLKGVGLSTYYPIPSLREGGDIDIYTFSADPSVMTDKEANDLADVLMEQKGIEVDRTHPKHSHFEYNRIEVENHKTFLDIERCALSPQVEETLRSSLNPQTVTLCNGHDVLIPSDEFNSLFVAFHALQHYGCGLTLHHIYDWACIIKRKGLSLSYIMPADSHFSKGVDVMTWICNEYLGTSVPVSEDRRLVAEMLHEIFNPFDYAKPVSGFRDELVYKLRRFEHNVRTRNRYLHTPLWRSNAFWKKIGKSIVWHFKKLIA